MPHRHPLRPLLILLTLSMVLVSCSGSAIGTVQQAPWPRLEAAILSKRPVSNLEVANAAAGSSGQVTWLAQQNTDGNEVVEADIDRSGAGIDKPQTVWIQWMVNKSTNRVGITGFAVDRQDKSRYEAELLVDMWTAS